VKRAVVFLAALVVALAGLGTGSLYAYDEARVDVLADEVSVGGLDVSGLHVRDAEELVRSRIVRRLQRPVVVHFGARRWVLSAQDAGLHTDVEGSVARALALSRRGTVVDRVLRDLRGPDRPVRVRLTKGYSPAAVHAFATRIAHAVAQEPVDARVEPSLTSLRRIPSKDGLAVRARALERMIGSSLVRTRASRTLGLPTRVVRPKVTTEGLRQAYPYYLTVSRPEKVLRLFVHLKLARTFRIAVGQVAYQTPTGVYTIYTKQVNPSWHVPLADWAGDLAGRVIPPGPDNPLKARWMGFYNGAGIHGTSDVSSLGRAASHGCVRMAIPDVIQLYDIVPINTPIYIA
jgi:lipoprotein-anchoring transpeptidase ErfK/SrfK